MSKDIKCSIVRDLLIGYMDETCSEETRNYVDEHLKNCPDCSTELKRYTDGTITSEERTEINMKAAKPFKKVKKRIRVLVCIICIFLVITVPAAAYIFKADSKSLYEADRTFLHVKDENIICNPELVPQIYSSAKGMYRRMYYLIKEKRGESNYSCSTEELTEEWNMINTVKPDFENAFLTDNLGILTVSIPLITPWDEYSSSLSVYLSWYAPGQYRLCSIELEYEGSAFYGYGLPNYITFGDMVEPWMFIQEYDNTVINAFRHGSTEDAAAEYSAPDTVTDEGYVFKSGLYKWEGEGGQETYLAFYDDRTLFYHTNSPGTVLSMKNTLRPSLYITEPGYTADDHQETYIVRFWGKNSVSTAGTVILSEINDSSLIFSGREFRRISDKVPDEKEIEKYLAMPKAAVSE